MAAYYFDTSGIVKRYVRERGTDWVRALTDPSAGAAVYLARLSTVEVISAVTRRQRAGDLSAARAGGVLARFRQDLTLEYRLIEVTPAVFADAMQLAESHALRANDAVQLAAAVALQTRRLASGLGPIVMVSADEDLNTAASASGLLVEDPNRRP
jgi:uncharacterized protein